MPSVFDRYAFLVTRGSGTARIEDDVGRYVVLRADADRLSIASTRRSPRAFSLATPDVEDAIGLALRRLRRLARQNEASRASSKRKGSANREHVSRNNLLGLVLDCLRTADERAVEAVVVADTLAHEGFDAPPLLFSREFRREPWLLEDLGRFRAARIALLEVERRLGEERCPPGSFLERVVARLQDWRSVYSPDGKPYRALTQTLARHDASVVPLWARWLPLLRLRRTAASALHVEVITWLAGLGWFHAREERAIEVAAVIEGLSREELRAGILETPTNAALPDAGDVTSTGVVLFASLVLVNDARPGPDLLRWVHRCAEEEQARLAAELRKRRTARPPIPLPSLPGVRFLATVRALRKEGAEMSHNVDGLAYSAVDGRAFVFAVTHRGQRATVRVARSGEVREARGPNNSSNEASEWGKEVLGAWGAGFPPRDGD